MVNSATLRSRASIARLRCTSAQTRSRSSAQPLAQVGMVLLDRAGDDPFLRLLALAGAENVEIGVEQLGAAQRRERVEARALVLVGLRAAGQRGADGGPFRIGDQAVAEDRRFDLLHRFIRPDAERLRKLRHRLRHAAGAPRPSASACRAGGSPRAPCRGTSRRRRRARPGRAPGRAGCPASSAALSITSRLICSSICVLGGLVEHLEARRDIGLEREQVQQLRAEGVDGVHLQAARRLQRQREQLPRPPALLGVDAAARRSCAWPRRARRRRARSTPATCRTRGSPCWRRRPW